MKRHVSDDTHRASTEKPTEPRRGVKTLHIPGEELPLEQALRDVLAELERAHDDLARWQQRLRDASARLPEPEYDDETGEPRNLSAAWQLGLEAHVDEQLDGAVRWLSRAVLWTERRFGL